MHFNQMLELKDVAERALRDKVLDLQIQLTTLYSQLNYIKSSFKSQHQNILSYLPTQQEDDLDAVEAMRKEFVF